MNVYGIVSIISITIGLVAVLASYRYLNHVFNRLSWIIHSFLTRRTIEEPDIKETRESKLISQLRQLVKIADQEIRTSQEEKEKIAGLISDLSHQLKTPLANITMYTELLKDPSLSEDERMEFIERTGEQAGKMQWLMNALLHASRLESGSMEFEVAPTTIKETLAAGISSVYAQAQKKNISIVIEEFDNCQLMHNRKWTIEALTNILDNAIKYSPEASIITIQVEPMELYTRIKVQDQGIGIAPDEYNLIFQRYYRSNRVEQKEGAGLGLYLAQLIFNKQGGYITVDSKPGHGSCFSIYLQNVIA